MTTPTDMDLLSTLAGCENALATLARSVGVTVPFLVEMVVAKRDGAHPYDVTRLDFQPPERMSAHQTLAWEKIVAQARAALGPLAETLGRLLRARLPVITGPLGQMGLIWVLQPNGCVSVFCDILDINDAHLTLHGAPLSTALLLAVHHLGDLRPTESVWADQRGWPHKHSVGAASAEEGNLLVERLRHIEAALKPQR